MDKGCVGNLGVCGNVCRKSACVAVAMFWLRGVLHGPVVFMRKECL